MSTLRVDEIIDEPGLGGPVFTNGFTADSDVTINGTLTATDIVESSSLRYKENIKPITNSIEIISNLYGVTYNRKDTHKFEAGLIAEDVQKIAPHLVSKNTDGSVEGIHYTKLTVYLLEVVKTLINEVENLKKNGNS